MFVDVSAKTKNDLLRCPPKGGGPAVELEKIWLIKTILIHMTVPRAETQL